MAKRNLFLHIGPPVAGLASPHEALRASRACPAARLQVPDVSARHLELAAMDILRTHQAAGLRRKEVEGRWAEVCRRAFKARTDVVVSQPALAGGTDDQLALALDGFAGMRLHVVLTLETASDLKAAAMGTWATAIAAKGRLHVLPVGPDPDPESFAEDFARLALRTADVEERRRLAELWRRRHRIGQRLARLGAA